ncbi:MAG: hypothetical protein ABL957_00905 [Parvularculaceae bacterium]
MNAPRFLKSFGAAAGAMCLLAVAHAQDVTPCPEDYGARATDYVVSRLDKSDGARVQIVSEPYRVAADVNGHRGLEGWGVDVRVKARQASGAAGVYLPYTVIFVDGAPVALCEDASDITRI